MIGRFVKGYTCKMSHHKMTYNKVFTIEISATVSTVYISSFLGSYQLHLQLKNKIKKLCNFMNNLEIEPILSQKMKRQM